MPLSPVTSSDPLEMALGETIVVAMWNASGLRVRVGIADGKLAAHVAARTGDRRGYREQGTGDRATRVAPVTGNLVPPVTCNLSPVTSVVAPGEGAAFLAALSIEDLPVSVEMRRRLRLFGLRTLGDLGRLPRGAVAAQFGKEGDRAWELAHGVERSPIVPYRAPTSVTERLAFPGPVDTLDALLAAARALLGRALHRPESLGRAARGVRLRAHLEDGRVWEREITFREPVGGSLYWSPSSGAGGSRPDGAQDRMFLALRHKVEASGGVSLPAPFVEVELTLLDICGESALQGTLFPSKRGQQLSRVAEAARQLKARYGRPVLAKVVEVEPWSRIPERRFALIDYDP